MTDPERVKYVEEILADEKPRPAATATADGGSQAARAADRRVTPERAATARERLNP